MTKTYRLVDATVEIKGETIPKETIEYYHDGQLFSVECYSIRGVVIGSIWVGYVNVDTGKPELKNASDIDIDSLSEDQITKLKARLNQ